MKKKVYLIHGWTYTLTRWEDFLRELKKRKIDYEMLKVPGLTEPSDQVWDVDRYTGWLRAKLPTHGHPIVLGHSNGGRIAMAYDELYPGHIKHLILMDSAGIYHDDSKTSLKRRVFGAVAKVFKPFIRGPIRKVMYRLIGAGDYGNASPNMRKTMINVTTHDKTFDPKQVGAPTSLIWGSDDTATPVRDGERLKKLIPNAKKLHVVEDAGHSPQGDHPAAVAELVKHILEGVK